jgi:hypothetical protein
LQNGVDIVGMCDIIGNVGCESQQKEESKTDKSFILKGGEKVKKADRHDLYSDLKGELYKRKITYEAAAMILNISTTAFNDKINGPSDFTVREVKTLAAALGFSPSIFFSGELQNVTRP